MIYMNLNMTIPTDPVPSEEQQAILDRARKEALQNYQTNETQQHGIKSAIVRRAAFDLFKSEMKKRSITKYLVKTLTHTKDNKTGISNKTVYAALKDAVFKPLKEKTGPKTRVKKDTNSNIGIGNLSCQTILATEIGKIRQVNSSISNREIRKLMLGDNRPESLKGFASGTIEKVMTNLLPVWIDELQHRYVTPATPTTPTTPTTAIAPKIPAGMTQQQYDSMEFDTALIKRMEKIEDTIDWLSGMKAWERVEFQKGLQNGKPYSMALEDECKDYIKILAKKMQTTYLDSFLRYTNELTHLLKIFDKELYDEKQSREKSTGV